MPISVLSPSASGALHLGSPGPSHHLMLCDPTLGLPLGKGGWSVLLWTHPGTLGTCLFLLGTYPASLGTHLALLGKCPSPLGTRPAPVGTHPALLGTCLAQLREMFRPMRDRSYPPVQCPLCVQVTVWIKVSSEGLSGACTQACLCAHTWVCAWMHSHMCSTSCSAVAQLLTLPGQCRYLQGCWGPAALWGQQCGGTESCQGVGGRQAAACWMLQAGPGQGCLSCAADRLQL